MASESCAFCGGPVNPHDQGSWKQVAGWVHGPKRDSMTLREDTGKFAHQGCINKARAGQAPDQPDMFDERPTGAAPRDDDLAEELFGAEDGKAEG